jgi:plastocyanin
MFVDARTRPGRIAGPLGVLTLILGTLAACTGQSAATSAPSAPTVEPSASASESASAAPSESASAPAALTELAIEAKDFSFAAPASIAAGPTRIVVNNTGQEDHQAQVAKLADASTFEDLTAALQAEDIPAALGMLSLVGGPTGVTPGATVATAANLEPGQHVFLCFVESPDGVPHLAKGMIGQLEVTGTASDGTLPAGESELALQDFAFVGATTLTPGQHALTVTNKGPQVHEATLVKLAEGVTVDDLRTAFTSTEAPSVPPPFTGAGGVAGISPNLSVTMEVDVEAGEYALICFVPDTASGAPHAALGMIGGLTVR